MKFTYSLIGILLILSSCSLDKKDEKGQVKNVILMIGDGMGVAQVYAAYTANKGELNLEKAQATGF